MLHHSILDWESINERCKKIKTDVFFILFQIKEMKNCQNVGGMH